jgi:hypothetical protein
MRLAAGRNHATLRAFHQSRSPQQETFCQRSYSESWNSWSLVGVGCDAGLAIIEEAVIREGVLDLI